MGETGRDLIRIFFFVATHDRSVAIKLSACFVYGKVYFARSVTVYFKKKKKGKV
jgi:hypothetical protein